jgi:hypothetical protein
MKGDNLNRLFQLAKQEAPPSAPEDFAATVLSKLTRQAVSPSRPQPIWDQFNALFPRLVFASATAILLCLGLELALSSLSSADLTEQIAQASMQWLLP